MDMGGQIWETQGKITTFNRRFMIGDHPGVFKKGIHWLINHSPHDVGNFLGVSIWQVANRARGSGKGNQAGMKAHCRNGAMCHGQQHCRCLAKGFWHVRMVMTGDDIIYGYF